jgi:hypothetical protein
MPAPAPPPRLTCRSAEVQAGVQDEAVVPEVPEPGAVLEPVGLAPVPAAPVLDAPELALADAVAPVLPAAAPDAPDVVDDAAHPTARSPALSSGTTSNAFFTSSPYCKPLGDALMSLRTP